MKIYLAWWYFTDGYESGDGCLGAFTKLEDAIKEAQEYAHNANQDHHSVVTEAELDNTSKGPSPFSNVLEEFYPPDRDFEEWLLEEVSDGNADLTRDFNGRYTDPVTAKYFAEWNERDDNEAFWDADYD